MDEKEWTAVDISVAVVIWILLMIGLAYSSDCVRTRNCGFADMILYALSGLGFVAPAYFGAYFFKMLVRK